MTKFLTSSHSPVDSRPLPNIRLQDGHRLPAGDSPPGLQGHVPRKQPRSHARRRGSGRARAGDGRAPFP